MIADLAKLMREENNELRGDLGHRINKIGHKQDELEAQINLVKVNAAPAKADAVERMAVAAESGSSMACTLAKKARDGGACHRHSHDGL